MELKKDKKIIGIGNALIDISVKLDNNNILDCNHLQKGSMTLVDTATLKSLEAQLTNLPQKLTSGGSSGNTIYGLGQLGCQAAFIGKVGADKNGDTYIAELETVHAEPRIFRTKDVPTGCAIAMISPDSERTFGTYLGAAVELKPSDLSSKLFEGYDIAYIEGYLVQNHELIESAIKIAKDAGLSISLDLSSYNVVEQNLDFLHEIVEKYVDILFANEEEAKAFTGKNPEQALSEIAQMVDIAIVKIGKKGSLVQRKDEKYHCDTLTQNCIDTTGAGDLFAAGFLYALSKEKSSIETCAKMGTIMASQVVQTYGARITDPKSWAIINQQRSEIGL